MSKNHNPIICYEYSRVSLSDLQKHTGTEENYIEIIDRWQKGTTETITPNEKTDRQSFFRVGNKEIIFQQFVGVLKIGNLTIEVLPKIDKANGDDADWQKVLLTMLSNALNLELKATNNAEINVEQTSVLQFYFNWFIKEVNLLMHQGLIKKYVAKTENRNALKGRLQLQKHIQHNIVHAERFYVTYNDYNQNHVYNAILQQCLKAILLIAKDSKVAAEAASILNWFPACDKVHISEKVFDKLVYHRKTERYKTAIKIAKIILLNFHPDLQGGNHDVIAIMFDMNKLWEQYVLAKLQQAHSNYRFYGQLQKKFWVGTNRTKWVKPDIVAYKKDTEEVAFILDTKWKLLDADANKNVSDADLKQMFVYNKLWNCSYSFLLYPKASGKIEIEEGNFIDSSSKKESFCNTIKLSILKDNNLDNDIWKELIEKQKDLTKSTLLHWGAIQNFA